MNQPTCLSLDVIDVREPCPQDWDAMSGDDRTRYCAGCDRHVHNLSAMSRDEAERLVCESAGRLCVRYERLASGTVRTLDYSEPPARARGWRFWSGIGLLGAVAATVLGAMWERPAPRGTGVMVGALPMPPISAPPAPTTNPSVMGGLSFDPPAESGSEYSDMP